MNEERKCKNMIEIRWHGRGGQGAFTASKVLGGAAVKNHQYAIAFPSFGPERRGAPIQAFTKIDSVPIKDRSQINQCDYIIFIDETLFSTNALADLKPGGKILLNTDSPEKYVSYSQIITIDASTIANRILHMPIANTAMLAALAAISDIVTKDELEEAIADYLPTKIIEKNLEVIASIYQAVGREKVNAG